MSTRKHLLLLVLILALLTGCERAAVQSTDLSHATGSIFFLSDRPIQNAGTPSAGENGSPYLFTMDQDGKNIAYLKDVGTIEWDTAWSPDGKTLAVDTLEGNSTELCLVLINAAGRRCLVPGGLVPRWSPDGQSIAYSTAGNYGFDSGASSRPITINIVNVASGNITELVSFKPPFSSGINYISSVTWATDGQTVAYTTQESETQGSIWLVPLSNRKPTSLTTGLAPAWSPTRNEIAFIREGNVWIYDLAKQAETILVRDPKGAYSPVWSPDGQQLVFTSRRDGNAEIYRVNRDGTGLVNLTNDPADDLFPSWRPKS